MSIWVLPTEVVNQIAAGEVIERPAQLLKELVENSLDAGATRVDIEYSQGGRFCKVIDNGLGISAEDMPKALLRFATSKISKAEDLWALNSFGFRGEALASIASVSEVHLISRQKGKHHAHQVRSLFGNIESHETVGADEGTTVIIQRLFENIPARLKFLKSDTAEHGALRQVLKALALAHPQVEFRVSENGKLIYYWPLVKSLQERAQSVLEVSPLYEAQEDFAEGRVVASFSDPHTVGKTSKGLWFFAQNRWIQDKSLQVAVMEAYRNTLMHGEYPVVSLWLQVHPDFVDVNIHPTKSQVKFRDAAMVFKAVSGTLRGGLEKAPWLSSTSQKMGDFLAGSASDAEAVSERISSASLKVNDDFFSSEISSSVVSENLSFTDENLSKILYPKKSFYNSEKSQGHSGVWSDRAKSISESIEIPEKTTVGVFQELKEARDSFFEKKQNADSLKGVWSQLEVLTQAHKTYIVCQSENKLVFIDQHAAHERVLFERLMKSWRDGGAPVQEFLIPLALDLSAEKVEALIQKEAELLRLGIFVEILGPSTLGVKAAPLFLKESILSSTLDRMATECVEHGESFQLEKMIGDMCASMACHSAVRAGQTLSKEQMEALLISMDEFSFSSFCPHGRPVSVDYDFSKLEKDFGRRL